MAASEYVAYFAFCGPVCPDRKTPFKKQFIEKMEEETLSRGKPQRAVILFHSTGGDTSAGLELHDFLVEWAPKITVFNIGAVCSAAAIMFLAIPKERRVMANHAVFMVHDVFLDIKGDPTPAELSRFEAKRSVESSRVRDIICRATSLSPDDWKRAAEFDLEVWRNRDDAIASGFVSSTDGLLIPKETNIIDLGIVHTRKNST